jgi:hypothetical protein
LVTNSHASISGKRCSESHGLICMMDHGEFVTCKVLPILLKKMVICFHEICLY